MTISTFGCGVTLRQRKETVIKSCAGPLKGINGMTGRAIFLKTGLDMVWLCGGRVILPVTVNAINSEDIKPNKTFREMAVRTVSRTMRSQQRETA
jgi:hypothetical protein